MSRAALCALLALACAGCATARLEKPPWPPPTPIVRPAAVAKSPRQATSLWSDGAPLGSVYEDHRARRIGDLVTVVVVESSQASRQATTDVSRDSSVAASVDGLLGAPRDFGLSHLYGKTGFDPSVKASTANSFKGAGSTTRKDLLSARVAAQVVSILEDGNLVVEGRRQVKVNGEDQYLYVHGIARPIDIAPDNTIASTALADGQILYGGSGLLADQQRPGWLYRALDAVWPF